MRGVDSILILLSLRAAASILGACGAPDDQQNGGRGSGGFHTAVVPRGGRMLVQAESLDRRAILFLGRVLRLALRQTQEILLKSHQRRHPLARLPGPRRAGVAQLVPLWP